MTRHPAYRLLSHAVVTLLLSVVFLALPAIIAARAAVDIQRVVSPGGVEAWLVEDYTVPIISIRFAFEGGSTQDPAGKEGLANLMSGLFDEGAGDLDSDAFQIRLDDAGAEMRFNAGRDQFYGSMRMLAERREEAFDLLRLAVEQPRFDPAPVDRIRSQIIAGIEADARDPQTEAQIAWARALYGDHPYGRRSEGTPQTLSTLGPQDLQELHRRLFARDGLTVAVVGAIDAETLKAELDRVFGGLPEGSDLLPVPDIEPRLGQRLTQVYDLPQSSITLAYPGIDRNDPQFFAAYLVNHVLGGGTFSSRLFDAVREKRGLAYDVGSALINNDHSDGLIISTSTRADRAAETLAVIRDEVRRLAEEGPTAEELEDAKRYVIGAYAIQNLTSSNDIAATLVQLQLDDLGIDYIARRSALIAAVPLDEAKKVAARLLSAEPAIMVVGPAPEGNGG